MQLPVTIKSEMQRDQSAAVGSVHLRAGSALARTFEMLSRRERRTPPIFRQPFDAGPAVFWAGELADFVKNVR